MSKLAHLKHIVDEAVRRFGLKRETGHGDTTTILYVLVAVVLVIILLKLLGLF